MQLNSKGVDHFGKKQTRDKWIISLTNPTVAWRKVLNEMSSKVYDDRKYDVPIK